MNKIWQVFVSHIGQWFWSHKAMRDEHTRWTSAPGYRQHRCHLCDEIPHLVSESFRPTANERPWTECAPSHFAGPPMPSILNSVTQLQRMAFQNNVGSQLFKPLQYHNARVHNHRTLCSHTQTYATHLPTRFGIMTHIHFTSSFWLWQEAERASDRGCVKERRENAFAPLHLGVKLADRLDFNINRYKSTWQQFFISFIIFKCAINRWALHIRPHLHGIFPLACTGHSTGSVRNSSKVS